MKQLSQQTVTPPGALCLRQNNVAVSKNSFVGEPESLRINLSSRFEKHEMDSLMAGPLTTSNNKATTTASTALDMNKLTAGRASARSAMGKSSLVGLVSDFTEMAGHKAGIHTIDQLLMDQDSHQVVTVSEFN